MTRAPRLPPRHMWIKRSAARSDIVHRELLVGPAKSQLQWRVLAKAAVLRREMSPLYWATLARDSAQGNSKISKVLRHEPRTAPRACLQG